MSTKVTILVACMLTTGCLNTLLLKYQDQKCGATEGQNTGCASFPVLQSLMMFFGESLCLIVLGILRIHRHRGRLTSLFVAEPAYTTLHTEPEVSMTDEETDKVALTHTKTLLLALPALCDICGTTIMSIGLFLVPASVFQMCRGSLVLFVGLFSVIFLGRKLLLHQWLALGLVSFGVFLVGLANVWSTDGQVNAKNSILGILLISGAQIFTASQFVIEEWILSKYSVEPLRVAGLEGVYGTLLTISAIFVTYFSYGRNLGMNGTFDVVKGFATISRDHALQGAFLLFALSIASFNFFGLSVTRTVSATSRSTVDTCRTLGIWAISILLGWEHFKFLQLVGFMILVYATLLFNGILNPPAFLATRSSPEVETIGEHTLI